MNKLMQLFNLATSLSEENSKKKRKKKTNNKKRNKKNSNENLVDINFFSMLFNNSTDPKTTFKKSENSDNEEVESNLTNSTNALIGLFNNISNNNSEENKSTSAGKTLKKPKELILDFIVSKDTASTKPAERYSDNINAIKLLNQLDSNNKKANKSQQKILSKFVGWGGLSNKLQEDSEAHSILGAEFENARKTVNTAFYTNATIVKYVWNVLLRLGFEKGRILEPSMGIGNFFIYSKEDMFYNSKIVGVEMDPTTSKIASHLFQSATIINRRYEEISDLLKDGSFDLAISNIPFGDIKVFDPTDKELNGNLFIHDYYFLKTLKKVRDKGIIAFVTSTGVMDKNNSYIRECLDEKCDFLGAVRLPSGAFSDTSVVSDIIFLQKNENKQNETNEFDEEDGNEDDDVVSKKKIDRSWLKTKRVFKDKDLFVNEYFINNPEMVIGELTLATNQFGECISVKPSKKLSSESFRKTFKYFPSEVYITPLTDDYMFEEDELKACEDENIKDGEFILEENKIYQRQGNKLIPSSYVGTRKEKLELYISIKSIVKTLIQEQLQGCSDERLNSLQDALNNEYDKFVSQFGFINGRANKSLLNQCILYSMIAALENYDLEEKTYYKADIFSKRTIAVEKEFIPEDIEDAICLSFTTLGAIDVDFIAEKLNRNVKDITEELIEREIVFIDPLNTSNLIYRDEYLSGYVKNKLKVAIEIAKTNPAIERNVAALKIVIPDYITDVAFNFASTWIPSNIKEDFIKQTLDIYNDKYELKLLYTAAKGYSLIYSGYVPYAKDKVEWGSERKPSFTIIDAILNLGDLTVTDTKLVDGKEKRVKNIEQTQLALNIAEKWKIEFVNYINSKPETLKYLTDIYNEEFNGYLERSYSNIFKTININPNISLRDHQLRAISRMIQSKTNTLLCHSVGSGKTYTAVAYAEESARIGNNKGIKSKNLFIVPNHLCKSYGFAKEYLTLYPQAKILACTPEDFKKSNRRKLISKIALGDWTSVIIPYSVLSMIPLKPSTEIELLKERLNELNETLSFYEKNSDNRISIKDLEKAKENFEIKIKKLSDRHIDNGLLFWEDLGITNIFVDEAHNYKNLFVPKKIQVAGVSNSSAKKSQDLYNKISYQRKTYGDGCITFMTATPISNSMSEMYILLKYLSPKRSLEQYRLESFDAFAANFGEVVTNMEIDPTGQGFRLKARFSKFCNLGELITVFREVTDVVNIQDIDDIKIPKHIEGKPIVRTVQPTPEMKNYIDKLVKRAESISNGGVNPEVDNMLKITNEGRKIAVAPRLVGIDQDSPKLLAVADDVAEIYRKFPNGTQLLFSDLGTPKDDGSYSVYDELKTHIINNDVPEHEIKFIHDAKTTEQRTKMISDFNEGNFKILIGSTSTCGEGVNFQQNIKNLSNIDVPWKPSSVEQRVGRAFRFGNVNEEVYEFRYVTNSSFDAYSWQLVEFKSKYIAQVLSATSSSRVAEDLETSTLTYEACKACAANNPKLLELATIKEQIQKLQVMEKAHKHQMLMSMNQEKMTKENLAFTKKSLEKLNKDIAVMKDTDNFIINLNNKNYSNSTLAIEELGLIMKEIDSKIIGYIYNLPIKLEVTTTSGMLNRSFYIGSNYNYKLEFKAYPKMMFNSIKQINTLLLEKRDFMIEKIEQYSNDLRLLEGKTNVEFEHKEELQNLLLAKKNLETELALENNIK